MDECTNIRILYSMFFRYMFSITTFVPFTHKAPGGIGGRRVRGVETCGCGAGVGAGARGRGGGRRERREEHQSHHVSGKESQVVMRNDHE